MGWGGMGLGWIRWDEMGLDRIGWDGVGGTLAIWPEGLDLSDGSDQHTYCSLLSTLTAHYLAFCTSYGPVEEIRPVHFLLTA